MKVNAIILAGGIGSRMKADKPKQFIEINGAPVIVDTINNFQKNERVNGILVVCLKEWIPYLKEIIKKFHLTKVTNIVEGGHTGHDSTRNGIFFLKNELSDDDYVIIQIGRAHV